jgi:uncharacterized protein (TIGR03083 family)
VSDPILTMLHDAWAAMVRLADDVPAAAWATPTDCPGWTVQDQFAHVVGSERSLDGDALPGPALRPPYVHNDLGAFNEAWVEHYRSLPAATVVADLRRVTEHRWSVIENLTDDQLAVDFLGPTGVVPLRDFFALRVMDITGHEHDVRRALKLPIDLTAPAVDLSITQMLRAFPKVVAKQAALPDGSLIQLMVDAEQQHCVTVAVQGRRGAAVDVAPSAATTVIDMDGETYLRLSWGRLEGAEALESALVGIEGSAEFGRRVLAAMNVML